MDTGEGYLGMVESIYSSISSRTITQNSIEVDRSGLLLKGIEKMGWSGKAHLPAEKGIMVLSVGKGAVEMLNGAVSAISGSGLDIEEKSMAITPDPDGKESDHDVLVSDHPVPGERTERCSEELVRRLDNLEEGTSLLFLLSGGASSSIERPLGGLTMEHISLITDRMLGGGYDIRELNTIRTHISGFKGGGLLNYIGDRPQASIVMSDVIGDDPRFIGSGPTHPWIPEIGEVKDTLDTVNLSSAFKEELLRIEKPRKRGVSNHPLVLVANNMTAVRATYGELVEMGHSPFGSERSYDGYAAETGKVLLGQARFYEKKTGTDSFVAGGETTVNVRGDGIGGRNTEMALSLVPHLKEGELVLCLTTDGKDGRSSAAGAAVRGDMFNMAGGIEEIRDSLRRSDSASLLDEVGALIKTGPTGTNLGDLFIHLASSEGPRRHRR